MGTPEIDSFDNTNAGQFLNPQFWRAKPGKRRHKRSDSKPHLTEEYKNHIQSLWWKNFRRQIIAERGKKCHHCPATKRLQVHHKHYRNLGHELPEDVELLCPDCHRKADNRRKLRKIGQANARKWTNL